VAEVLVHEADDAAQLHGSETVTPGAQWFEKSPTCIGHRRSESLADGVKIESAGLEAADPLRIESMHESLNATILKVRRGFEPETPAAGFRGDGLKRLVRDAGHEHLDRPSPAYPFFSMPAAEDEVAGTVVKPCERLLTKTHGDGTRLQDHRNHLAIHDV
jgi:hypothetical protein